MSESKTCPSSSTNTDSSVPFKVLSKPSDVIKTFNQIIRLADSSYEMTLITMRRSFLLVIDNVKPERHYSQQNKSTMSSEMLVQSFISGNSPMNGLSLAIGGHSTCLIASDHSVASLSLASRLSKSLNNNGPVYVANNMQASDDTLNQLGDILTNLYQKIFQFVRNNYKGSQTIGN